MKKLLLFVTIAVSILLGACTQVVQVPDGERPNEPRPSADFSVVLTEARFNELGTDADFSNEKSVESVVVGEKLVFITSHRTGPQYVHIRVFDTNGKAVEEIGPTENWEGIAAEQYVIRHTPNQAGRYHFQAVMSGSDSAPFADSPYNIYVDVEGEGSSNPPPSETCSSTARATLDTPLRVSRNESFNIEFFVPCDSTYVSLQIYNNAGNEVGRWTLSTSEINRYEGEKASYRFSHEQNDRLHIQLTVNGKYSDQINRYMSIGSGSDGGNPPPSETCTSNRRATLDAPSSVARNSRFDISFYVPCDSTYVSLQVYNNAGNEVDRWTLSSRDLDRHEGSTVTRRISYDRNDRLFIELTVNGRYSNRLDRYVRIGSGPGGTTPPPSSCRSSTRASLDTPSSVARNERFDVRFYVPCGSDYVSLQVYNNAGNEVDRWTLSSSDLDRYEGREASFRLSHSRNEELQVQLTVNGRYPSQINRTVRVGSTTGTPPPHGTENCPANLSVAVRYGDFDYTSTVYIPRSGEIFRLTWESRTADFPDGRYVQLYDVSRGVDVYSSTERRGNHGVRPSDLAVGEYQLRFSGYFGDGRTACVREVTIHIQ